jgi:hypothetical protein
MFGSTISALIENVAEHRERLPTRIPQTTGVIPLAGDPLFMMNQYQQPFSASMLAARLEEVLTGRRRPDYPSLSGAPAYISTQFMTTGKAAVACEITNMLPGYERIFGRRLIERVENVTPGRDLPAGATGAMIDQVDTVLTGVGALGTGKPGELSETTGVFIRERVAQEQSARPDCAAIILRAALGEFCGHLLAQPAVSSNDSRVLDELNLGWTGFSLEDVDRVARGATPEGSPGMVVAAFGASKAPIVAEVLRRKMVNVLLIDGQLAKELARLVETGFSGSA